MLRFKLYPSPVIQVLLAYGGLGLESLHITLGLQEEVFLIGGIRPQENISVIAISRWQF